MKRIELDNQNYIIRYSKADELPLRRYSKFQKYLLYKTGIGSDIESVGSHFHNLFSFQSHEKHEEAIKETENLYYSFFAILQEISYEDLAFVTLIYSINGVPFTDISEDRLNEVIDWLSDNGMTKERLSLEVNDTRNKILEDLKVYFPKFYPESDDLTFFQKTKQQLMLTADKLLLQLESGEENVDEEITRLLKEISLFFVDLNKPKNFNSSDHDNCTIILESQFESLCSMIEANGGSNPKDFTLIEFYSRLEFIRKSNSVETVKK